MPKLPSVVRAVMWSGPFSHKERLLTFTTTTGETHVFQFSEDQADYISRMPLTPESDCDSA